MKMYYRQFFSLELLRQKCENLKISENLVSQEINVEVYYALASAKCKVTFETFLSDQPSPFSKLSHTGKMAQKH